MNGKWSGWEQILGLNVLNADGESCLPGVNWPTGLNQLIRKQIQMLSPEKPRILFLFSDTGGGHRSATEAIIEAIQLEFPDEIDLQMIDLFKEYAPPPMDLVPDIYPPLSRMPQVWKIGYRLSDGRRRTKIVNSVVYPYIRRSIRKLIQENPCDLVVSVHGLMTSPVARVLKKYPIGFVTVVTDLISTHATWYEKTADLIIVPTEQAYKRGLDLGIPAENMKVIGLPVADKFRLPAEEKETIRKNLGWSPEGFYILLVGGGEGMGPIDEFARAINESCPDVSLIIVTGRNPSLKSRLEKINWNIPAHILGFVTNMHELMRASDVLATKAGPGTISEAMICQLPIILYSYMPGQEDGNIDYVVNEGVGYWAPDKESFTTTLRQMIDNPQSALKAKESCLRLARPNAARQIAAELVHRVKDIKLQQNP